MILGIDEVGRGAWAGPMVVGAVVLDDRHSGLDPESSRRKSINGEEVNNQAQEQIQPENLKGLKDSKQLTKLQRENLSQQIKSSAVAIGIGWVSAAEIDELGLSAGLKLATRRAVDQIDLSRVQQIIIDGTIRLLDDPRVVTLVKADAKISAVSAAAIAAKVFRDNYMTRLATCFPTYEFDKHVGYGTAKHRAALEKYGALNGIHRQSFAPIKNLTGNSLTKEKSVNRKEKNEMNKRKNRGRDSRQLGYKAEETAVEFLKNRGHQIIARNWKTKFCEIDIISVGSCHPGLVEGSFEDYKDSSPGKDSSTSARNDTGGTIFFTEVKYRENADFGDGLSAITPRKLKQMKFAAEIFLNKNAEMLKDFDVCLSVISLSGKQPKVDEFIDNIDR